MKNWDRLIKARKEKKITQAEMARKCGISQGSYVRWENLTYQPNINQLKTLSMILEVPIDYLVYNDTFTNNDAEYWAKRAELEQRYRELLARYPDKAAGKASILDGLTEEMGRDPGESAGTNIDEGMDPNDPFPSTIINIEEKK